MSLIKRVWKFLWTPVPITILMVLIFLFVLRIFFNDWLIASIPDLIGTFIGAILGFQFGIIAQRRADEEEKKSISEYEEVLRLQDVNYIYEAITEEAQENLDIIEDLKKLQYNQIPGRFLRTSSWYTVQEYIRVLEDKVLIEKLHELYNNIGLLNTDMDYLRQNIFQTVPVLDTGLRTDKNKIFLHQQIVNNSYTIQMQYQEIEKVFMRLRSNVGDELGRS